MNQNGDTSAALRHLSSADPRLAAVIARVGPYAPTLTPDPFVALVSSIIHQQLSMKAAATIGGRVRDLCPRRKYTTAAISALSDEQLRACGLSRMKVVFLRDLVLHFESGKVKSNRLRRMSDEEVIGNVTQVKGIGRWTAEMLLMFCLKRPDIWPVDDLGLRKAAQKLLGARKELSMPRLQKLGDSFRPHRSIATWYLWRSLEGPLLPALTHD